MSEQESDFTLNVGMLEIALNDLAFQSLNMVAVESSEDTAQAVDRLSNRVRQGTLAIALALCSVAEAIRESNA